MALKTTVFDAADYLADPETISKFLTEALEDDDPRVNPNGGAIALGHPLGMSGSRILLTAAMELRRKNKKYALVTMCIGVGQGYAVIIENCHYNHLPSTSSTSSTHQQ